MIRGNNNFKQQLDTEENKLQTALSRVYNQVKQDFNMKLSDGLSVTWSDIQMLHRQQINDFIRSSVATIYETTARKVTEKDIKVPFFLTDTDQQEIVRLSKKYDSLFFNSMQRIIMNKAAETRLTNLLNNNDFSPSPLTELKDGFIGMTTTTLRTEVAAQATITKSRHILLSPVFQRQQQLSRMQRKLIFRNNPFKSAALGSGTVESGPHFVWRTDSDANVCEICTPFDQRSFRIDDPNISTPIIDTHINCRCELELIDAEFTGQESEIDQSMDDLILL